MANKLNKTVVVGLSGGVDSAVSAYLLKQAGYNVIALFMQNWDSSLNQENNYQSPAVDKCDAQVDYEAAEAVAKFLDIPLYRTEFIREYWDHVFAYFLDEYRHDRTPNPDVLCNTYIKFDAFLNYARQELHADYIAMGHYARVTHHEGYSELKLSADQNKDQTYFLCGLNQEQLGSALFPIGHLTKPQVRELARQIGLPNAERKDSTGICFIGERNFQKFLENYLPNQPGEIVDITTGKVVGHHVGTMYYTIGQRKGLNLGGQTERYFVCQKDLQKRIIYVAPDHLEDQFLISDTLEIRHFNWISRPLPAIPIRARFRHRQAFQDVQIEEDGDTILVHYQPQKNIAPGQFCVLYQGDNCLGGGVIEVTHQSQRSGGRHHE